MNYKKILTLAQKFQTMSMPELHCPSCGAPLKLAYRFSQMVVCGFCDQTSHLENNGLVAKGEKQKLSDYGSKLYTGADGKILNRSMRVLGRLRYEYPDGFWDEWCIKFDDDDNFFWLQEDEGDYALFAEEQVSENLPAFEKAQVGVSYPFNGINFFVSEKNRGWIAGGEGELPHRVTPGEKADFIDGFIVGQQRQAAFELLSSGTQYFTGDVIQPENIDIKSKDYGF